MGQRFSLEKALSQLKLAVRVGPVDSDHGRQVSDIDLFEAGGNGPELGHEGRRRLSAFVLVFGFHCAIAGFGLVGLDEIVEEHSLRQNPLRGRPYIADGIDAIEIRFSLDPQNVAGVGVDGTVVVFTTIIVGTAAGGFLDEDGPPAVLVIDVQDPRRPRDAGDNVLRINNPVGLVDPSLFHELIELVGKGGVSGTWGPKVVHLEGFWPGRAATGRNGRCVVVVLVPLDNPGNALPPGLRGGLLGKSSSSVDAALGNVGREQRREGPAQGMSRYQNLVVGDRVALRHRRQDQGLEAPGDRVHRLAKADVDHRKLVVVDVLECLLVVIAGNPGYLEDGGVGDQIDGLAGSAEADDDPFFFQRPVHTDAGSGFFVVDEETKL
mmetsp:Transcript_1484/g.3328  ORF Transcript_1484/g.3328 Transcript_1484/m.3328 type:complete len:379 (-) Transcript_1484:1030-2166(-)